MNWQTDWRLFFGPAFPMQSSWDWRKPARFARLRFFLRRWSACWRIPVLIGFRVTS